ncbi:MAG: tripartite tricarboxylate transporter TctB family protein [Treponema sp.]|jgi:hypothetical protein|nr:tripartite tricarboxylate transporter TctB family protein [Treponema sp.]
MTKNLPGNIFNMILVLSGVGLFISAQSIQTGSALAQGGDFMPKLLAVIWMVLSILIFLSGLREPKKEAGDTNIKKFLATLVLLFTYIFLLKPFGFVIVSILYTFIQMLLLVPGGNKSKKAFIIFGIVSIVIPIAVNLIFVNVFSLILPEGTVFK